MIRNILLTLFFSGSILPSLQAQWHVFPIMDNGSAVNRITVLLLSEGYTQEELDLFRSDAALVTDKLFAENPFRSYQSYFRVIGVEVASKESGASSFFTGDIRDTYFQATFGSGGGRDMSLLHPVGTNRLSEIQESLGLGWWNSITLVLVNDDRLGGTPSIVTRGSSSFEAAVHEIGHQFAQLADEYIEDRRGPLPGSNVTTITQRSQIPWGHWIEESTPIPTPDSEVYRNVVGLFEGANYQSNGWFRPQQFCKMRNSSDPFCAVCQELIIGRFYTDFNAGRILEVSPEPGLIVMPQGDELELRYAGPTPEHGLEFRWMVNGQLIEESSDVLDLTKLSLGLASHTVRLFITDSTNMVRSGALRLRMTPVKTWEISVVEGTSVARPEPLQYGIQLVGGYPNPSRDVATVVFRLQEPRQIRIAVYDVLGRRIVELASGQYAAGEHRISWDTLGLSRGMYVYRLTSGSVVLDRTFSLVGM